MVEKRLKMTKKKNKPLVFEQEFNINKEEREKFKKEIIYLDYFVESITKLRKELENDFEELKNYYLNKKEGGIFGILDRFSKAFFFKLEILLDCFSELEREILASACDHFKKQLNGEKYEEKELKKKITRLVDSFLTYYFSLFDIFVKNIIKISKLDLPNNIDNLGRLLNYLEKKENNKELKNFLKPLIDIQEDITQFKIYRNYIIHHGNLSFDIVRSKANDEYYLDSWYLNVIKNQKNREYSKIWGLSKKVNWFIRENLKKQLESFHEILEKIKKY